MENLGWHGHHYVGFFIAFQGFYKDILAIQYPDWFLGSGNHLELVHHPIQQWRTQIRLQCKKWQVYIQHRLSFPFSGPLPACRNLFSSTQIFRRGRYQPGWTGILWPVEGNSQPVTISKKWKNQRAALRRKKAYTQALLKSISCHVFQWQNSKMSIWKRPYSWFHVVFSEWFKIWGAYMLSTSTTLQHSTWVGICNIGFSNKSGLVPS